MLASKDAPPEILFSVLSFRGVKQRRNLVQKKRISGRFALPLTIKFIIINILISKLDLYLYDEILLLTWSSKITSTFSVKIIVKTTILCCSIIDI